MGKATTDKSSVKTGKPGARTARGAIEILEEGARVAVLMRRKGRPIVADLIEVDFPTPPEGGKASAAAKGQALRDALRSRRWRLTGATLVLPKNVVTLRLATLPSIQDAEIAEMARFEAQKHIPFNVERHVITHAVLSKEGVEGSRALIAAVDRAALDEPLAICQEAKVELATARVSSLAVVEALLLEPPSGHAESTFALVNIGWNTVDITIVSRGTVCFARSGSMGVSRIADQLATALEPGAQLTRDHLGALDANDPPGFFERRGRPTPRARVEAPSSFVVDDFAEEAEEEESPEAASVRQIDLTGPAGGGSNPSDASGGRAGEIVKWLDRLVQEVGRTQTFATREFDIPELEAVYLSGVGSYIQNIDGYIRQRLRCPVISIPPPGSLEFAGGEGTDLRAAWGEFAVTIGAAAGEAMPKINLLPSEYTESLIRRKRRRAWVATGVLGLLFVGVSAAFGVQWFKEQRRLLEFYQYHNERLETRVKTVREMDRRLKIVRSIVEDDRSSSAVLKRITNIDLIRTRDVALTMYHYFKGEGITLQGHAQENAQVGYYKDRLEKTGLFELVTEEETRPYSLPRPRPTVVQFTLKCLFSASGER